MMGSGVCLSPKNTGNESGFELELWAVHLELWALENTGLPKAPDVLAHPAAAPAVRVGERSACDAHESPQRSFDNCTPSSANCSMTDGIFTVYDDLRGFCSALEVAKQECTFRGDCWILGKETATMGLMEFYPSHLWPDVQPASLVWLGTPPE